MLPRKTIEFGGKPFPAFSTSLLAFVIFIACQCNAFALMTGASFIPFVLLYVLWKCPNWNSEPQLQIPAG